MLNDGSQEAWEPISRGTSLRLRENAGALHPPTSLVLVSGNPKGASTRRAVTRNALSDRDTYHLESAWLTPRPRTRRKANPVVR
jgi:hypothetical protein